MIVAFEDLELDLSQVELRSSGVRVRVERQVFEVLAYLVNHRDRVVTKDELMDNVWGGRFVSETAVTSRIKQARQAVGDDGRAQRLIRTVHGHGYRFVGSAREVGPAPASRQEPIHYAVSDGLQIAYQVTGRGEWDIVLVAGFVSHLELDWADARHAGASRSRRRRTGADHDNVAHVLALGHGNDDAGTARPVLGVDVENMFSTNGRHSRQRVSVN